MSEIRVDSIKNTAGTGSPAFTGTITADGFLKTGGGTGFLKADGSVDTNTYLSSVNIGNGTVSLATSGTGLSLSASPSFTLNQSSNKSITISLASNSGNVASTIVARDGNGNSSFNNVNANDVIASDDVIANGAITGKGGAYFYNTSMVNNPLTLTDYFQSPALGTDVSATFATGMNIAIASNNVNGAALEFYKTRRSGTLSGTRVTTNADDAVLAIHATADDGTSDHIIASVYGSVTRTASLANSVNKAGFWKFLYRADESWSGDVFGSAPLREWIYFGEAISSTDGVGPTTIRIPYVATATASANAVFDGNNRLVRGASTRAVKRDIEDIERSRAYHVLNNLRPVWYRSTAPADNPEWGYYGVIAEEVAEVDPRLAIWSYADDQYETVIGSDNSMHKKLRTTAQLSPQSVQYDRLALMLFTVVKDQQNAIASLESKVRALESAQN